MPQMLIQRIGAPFAVDEFDGFAQPAPKIALLDSSGHFIQSRKQALAVVNALSAERHGSERCAGSESPLGGYIDESEDERSHADEEKNALDDLDRMARHVAPQQRTVNYSLVKQHIKPRAYDNAPEKGLPNGPFRNEVPHMRCAPLYDIENSKYRANGSRQLQHGNEKIRFARQQQIVRIT
jgi:hypothetical protein